MSTFRNGYNDMSIIRHVSSTKQLILSSYIKNVMHVHTGIQATFFCVNMLLDNTIVLDIFVVFSFSVEFPVIVCSFPFYFKLYYMIIFSFSFISIIYPEELYSGIEDGRVLNLQFYTHRRQKLTLLYLYTDLFRKENFLTL